MATSLVRVEGVQLREWEVGDGHMMSHDVTRDIVYGSPKVPPYLGLHLLKSVVWSKIYQSL